MRTTRRRPETEQAKLKFQNSFEYKDNFKTEHYFEYSNENVIREFQYWVIIDNRFPYDIVLSVNHMLAPKRLFGNLHEANPEELVEYYSIMETLREENFYESRMENFMHGRSVQQHLHIHLMVWKPEREIVGQEIDWDAYPALD